MVYGPEGGAFTGYAYIPPTTDGPAGAASNTAGARPLVAYAAARVVAGQLVAVLGPPGTGTAWEVRRITVQSSALATSAYVYVGTIDPQNLTSGTSSGHFDENDCNEPLFVPEGTALTIVWSTAVGNAGARIEYAVV